MLTVGPLRREAQSRVGASNATSTSVPASASARIRARRASSTSLITPRCWAVASQPHHRPGTAFRAAPLARWGSILRLLLGEELHLGDGHVVPERRVEGRLDRQVHGGGLAGLDREGLEGRLVDQG